MSNYYTVSVYKTFAKDITVKADSPEEAATIAYALNDNPDFDEDFEFCDDDNRLELHTFDTLSPEGVKLLDADEVFSRDDITEDEFELAKKSQDDFDKFWERWDSIVRERAIKEYLENQK